MIAQTFKDLRPSFNSWNSSFKSSSFVINIASSVLNFLADNSPASFLIVKSLTSL